MWCRPAVSLEFRNLIRANSRRETYICRDYMNAKDISAFGERRHFKNENKRAEVEIYKIKIKQIRHVRDGNSV